MRSRTRTITAVFIFLLAVSELCASSPGAVYVNFVEGSVEHIAANARQGVPARVNKALAEGESLMVTGPGKAELFIRDGSVVRIAEGSRLKVLSIERGAVQFSLESGKAYVNFTGLKGYPLFFNTPSSQVDAFERSAFRVDINAMGESEISVLAGEIYVAQPKGRMKIIVGTRLIMRKDGKSPVYTTNRPAGDWDRWNRMKDGEMHLPSGDRSEPRRSTTNPAVAVPDPNASAVAAISEARPAPVVTHEYIYVGIGPAWGYSWYPHPYRPYPRHWLGPSYPGWRGPSSRWHGGYRGYHGHPPRRHWR
jgi:hypothetical protein